MSTSNLTKLLRGSSLIRPGCFFVHCVLSSLWRSCLDSGVFLRSVHFVLFKLVFNILPTDLTCLIFLRSHFVLILFDAMILPTAQNIIAFTSVLVSMQ